MKVFAGLVDRRSAPHTRASMAELRENSVTAIEALKSSLEILSEVIRETGTIVTAWARELLQSGNEATQRGWNVQRVFMRAR